MPGTQAVTMTGALPARLRSEGGRDARTPGPGFKLDSPEPRQGPALLWRGWKAEGGAGERISVAEPTCLGSVGDTCVRAVSCQGEAVKLQTVHSRSQNSGGVAQARGPRTLPPFDLSLDVEKAFYVWLLYNG